MIYERFITALILSSDLNQFRRETYIYAAVHVLCQVLCKRTLASSLSRISRHKYHLYMISQLVSNRRRNIIVSLILEDEIINHMGKNYLHRNFDRKLIWEKMIQYAVLFDAAYFYSYLSFNMLFFFF